MSTLYKTPLDTYIDEFIAVDTFEQEVVGQYAAGTADAELPADAAIATSWIPSATGRLRDFSNIASDIPELNAALCVGCMECVTQCPDTAIIAKVVPDSTWKKHLTTQTNTYVSRQAAITKKFYAIPQKKGTQGGVYSCWLPIRANARAVGNASRCVVNTQPCA